MPVKRTLIGMLTPSSNTALEPITTMMLAGLPEVTAHFGRFRVKTIALSDTALSQFDDSNILAAADLLAHARVGIIGWSGTSASWLGFERDKALCERIRQATGIAATTSVLAINEILRATGARDIAFVTPYTDDVQERINANYAKAGFNVVAERHLGLRHNFSFSEVTEEEIIAMTREVAKAKPQAIIPLCTNLRSAPLVEALEKETGIPIYDSISTAMWKCLKLSGVDPKRVQGWGRLFREVA